MEELSLKEMIEKYKKELIEFSKQNKEILTQVDDELEEEAVPTGYRPVQSMMTPENPNSDITELEGTNPSGYNSGRIEKTYKTYDEFVRDNPETGTLRIQGYIASQAYPATDAQVEIRKELEKSSYLIYSGKTDESGVYGPVKLNAPQKTYSEEFSDRLPYASYLVTVKKEGFITMIYKNLPVFPGIESNQTINFIPSNQVGDNVSSIVIDALEPIDL